MEGPPLGPGGEDITWPDQVAPRGRKASSTRKIKPQTSNLKPQPLSRDFFCTLKQKAPDTWWVSISGHWGVAEVFVLYIMVVVNTMPQVQYRFMLKKLRLALGVSIPLAPIIHIFFSNKLSSGP